MSETNPYLRLKLAQQLFQKTPGNLEPDERQRVDQIAARQLKIEQRILSTLEAAQVILPESSLQQAVAEIRGRYSSDAEYLADLETSGLDPTSLTQAIERDLKVEAVLDRVGSQIAEVSDNDVEIYYLMHRERFRRPENRTLRHILVTINEDLPGSDRVTALDKIEAIRDRLQKAPKRFGEQALKHSECPTAMNGGLLGIVKRGQLFPELEDAAFDLSPGEVSEVLESPLGFHVLQCVAIEADSELQLGSVRAKIRERITDSRRKAGQKAWIAGLFRQPAYAE
jgi:peptidyl-prolyl cis-trans isomerase C